MTFAIVSVENSKEKVVGTIWADAEAHAQLLASSLMGGSGNDALPFVIRRAEEREIPMKLAEPTFASPFHA